MEGNQRHGDQAGRCLSLAERRERFAAAREALQGLAEVTWQCPSGGGPDGLAGLMEEVDALGMACDLGRVSVLRDALSRGETPGGSAAMTPTQWVRAHAPSTKAGGAAAIVNVATAFGKAVNQPVKEAVESGRLPVRSAATVVSEFEKLSPLLGDLMQEPALTTLVDIAADDGPNACRKVRPFILARYGLEDAL
ncbi:hypothetical protein SAMN05216199_0628, partial [Pedococcus cremeus]